MVMPALLVPLVVGVLMFSEAAEPGPGKIEYHLIVNKSNPIDQLRADDVSRLFLRKTRTWEHGESVKAVDLSSTSLVRARFSKGVLNQSMGQLRVYWRKQIYSGRVVPPPTKRNDSEVLEFVAKTPGGVGYVSPTATLPKGVKVVKVRR